MVTNMIYVIQSIINLMFVLKKPRHRNVFKVKRLISVIRLKYEYFDRA